MLFKSAIITQASGSIGGVTGSRNAGGMYFRARAIPTNPNTPLQGAVRALMGTISNAWRLLTTEQREAWGVYAQNVPLPNSLGEQRNVSGQNQYIRANIPRVQAELPVIDDAPTTFNVGPTPFLDGTQVVNDGGVVQLEINPGSPGAAGTLLVYMSRPQDPTINYFRGPYQRIGTQAFVTPGAVAASFEGTSPYTLTAGQKVFFRIQSTLADGRLSSDLQAVITVIAFE